MEFQNMVPQLGSQLYGEANRRIEQNIMEAIDKEKDIVCAYPSRLLVMYMLRIMFRVYNDKHYIYVGGQSVR